MTHASSSSEPRHGSEVLAGQVWLPRMIDKARLDAAGTIEQFDLEYPCPLDRQLLSRLGVDSVTFQTIAVENTSDEAIVAQLRDKGVL